MAGPSVSVNICCYNSEKFIKETIQSVLAQTFKDLEIIIVDDGSKDQTREMIHSFKDPRIKYFYQENQGLSASRNRALALSSGEYIAILDHDDTWEPDKLELQAKLLGEKPEVGLVYSDALMTGENRKDISFFSINSPHRGKVTEILIRRNFIPCPTVLMRKSFMEQIAPFRTDLQIAEEYEYFLRLSLVCEFDYINMPLAKYRLHPGNASKDLIRLGREEILVLKGLIGKGNNGELNNAIRHGLFLSELSLIKNLIQTGERHSARQEIRTSISEGFNKPVLAVFYLFSFMPVIVAKAMFGIILYGKKLPIKILNRLINRTGG